MSLFTVIKYGNVDLESVREVNNLPAHILAGYYKKFFRKEIGTFENGARTLAIFYQLSSSVERERQRAKFIESLMEQTDEEYL